MKTYIKLLFASTPFILGTVSEDGVRDWQYAYVDEAIEGRIVGEVDNRDRDKYLVQRGDVILFLGNSITNWADPLVDYLKSDIQTYYPQLLRGENPIKFITSGVNGEQAFEGLNRLPELLQTHKPTLCVVNYGTCEVTFKNEGSYIPAMKEIIRELKNHGVTVTVVSPPPCSPSNWEQGDNWPASQFVRGLPVMAKRAGKIAKREEVVFADAFKAMGKHILETKDELTTDGIHLNDKGYRVMADAIQEAWGYGQSLTPCTQLNK